MYETTTETVPCEPLATMGMSSSIDKLAASLAKAQSEMAKAHKDKKNPFFKSTYADLAACWDACRDPLSKNGLAVVQVPAATDAGVMLTTILMHSSGQWVSGTLPVNPVKDDPQGMGSALTYARRYGLCALVGISPADDDGNAASGRDKDTGKPQGKPQGKRPPSRPKGETKPPAADNTAQPPPAAKPVDIPKLLAEAATCKALSAVVAAHMTDANKPLCAARMVEVGRAALAASTGIAGVAKVGAYLAGLEYLSAEQLAKLGKAQGTREKELEPAT